MPGRRCAGRLLSLAGLRRTAAAWGGAGRDALALTLLQTRRGRNVRRWLDLALLRRRRRRLDLPLRRRSRRLHLALGLRRRLHLALRRRRGRLRALHLGRCRRLRTRRLLLRRRAARRLLTRPRPVLVLLVLRRRRLGQKQRTFCRRGVDGSRQDQRGQNRPCEKLLSSLRHQLLDFG
jgi:hypothetical protein